MKSERVINSDGNRSSKNEKSHSIVRRQSLIKSNCCTNVTFTVTFALQAINIFLAYESRFVTKNDISDYSLIDFFHQMCRAILLTFMVIGLFQTLKELKRNVTDVNEEMAGTDKIIKKISDKKWRKKYRGRFAEVSVNDENPFKVNYSKRMQTPSKEFIDCEWYWELGSQTILNHIHDLQKLIDKINFCDTIKDVEPLADPDFLHHTSPIFISKSWDGLSKSRIINVLLFAPIGSATYLLKRLGYDDTATKTVWSSEFLIFALIGSLSIACVLLESHLMYRKNLKANLEGFTHIHRPFTLVQNCLAQQVTRELAFYPRNKNLNEALKYIFSAYFYLETVKKHQNFKLLPQKLQTKIMSLQPIMRVKNLNHHSFCNQGLFSSQVKQPEDSTVGIKKTIKR